jgi:hypothetical protein
MVEGNDDQRLIESVFVPVLRSKDICAIPWRYSQRPDEEVEGILRSYRQMRKAGIGDYLYLADADVDEEPCATQKRENIESQFTHLEQERIVVVYEEIETWYIAGVPAEARQRLGLPPNVPQRLTKEQFNHIVPAGMARIDFMVELLKAHRIENAKKETSYDYFCRRLGI